MKLRRWWWTIAGGLLLAAAAWAIYAVNWFLFLSRTFPTSAPTRPDPTDFQAYAVAFGPLLVVVLGLAGLRAIRRRHL